ncbi:MAG TPA: D-glycerate dehydrogenase [Phycisphaerae bacterium]|nr:D-glycerate dehydrogenase [Phycisphaerae bacterium]
MDVLITRPIPPAGPLALEAAGIAVRVSPFDRPLTADELLLASQDVDGLVTMLTDKIDANFLDARPRVKAIANFAVGFNNIDVGTCTARRIGVSNTPDVLTNATAEIAWTLLMAAARRAGEAERSLRSGQWDGWGPLQFLGVDVVGRTLGVIGAGRIGARLARMAAGFDMRVLYTNRRSSPAMEALGARLVPLDDLLRQSDFVSLHVPLTPETRHLIGGPQFALMKKNAVIVNTARGPVIDEAALVDALLHRRIFAAGLDVFENEPRLHPGLAELPNAVLLPHIGSATELTRSTMAKLAAENLVAMLSGRRPPTPVNPELWS